MIDDNQYPFPRRNLPKFGRFLVPENLRLAPHSEIRFPIRDEGNIINLGFIAHIEDWCEQKGKVNDYAGPEGHREFVDTINDDGMAFFVKTLVQTFNIERLLDDRDLKAHDRLCRLLDTLLYLVARGNLVYNVPKLTWVFAKPTAAPPTPEMQQKILARIRDDRDLQLHTVEEVTGLEIPRPYREEDVQ